MSLETKSIFVNSNKGLIICSFSDTEGQDLQAELQTVSFEIQDVVIIMYKNNCSYTLN